MYLLSDKSLCLCDKNSIFIESDPNGLFTVIAKEYRIDYYCYTVINDSLKLVVQMDLATTLGVGEKCEVKYVVGKDFLILPEKIKSSFEYFQ